MKRPERGEPSAAPETAGTRPARSAFEVVRENLEAVAVAVVLALIIRHFSVEAFEIPTGSMAPTLYGIHAWVECPNCETDFNIGLGSDPATGELRVHYSKRTVYWGSCPRCKLPHHRIVHDPAEPNAGQAVGPGDAFVCPHDGTKWTGEARDFKTEPAMDDPKLRNIECPICWYTFEEVLTSSNQTGGHKILVDKFTCKMSPFQRWDVIVFQFDRETNYIKRLIGLPGERVKIEGGDIYINDKVERKYTRPEVQQVLWTPVADLTEREKGFQREPAWKELFPEQDAVPAGSWSWSQSDLRWSVNSGAGNAERTAVLRYQRPLRNYYPYNILSEGFRSADSQVGDKKVAFTARPPRGAKGWIGAEIGDGEFVFQMRIPLGKADAAQPATIRRVPKETDPDHPHPERATLAGGPGGGSVSAEAALRPDQAARVEFENVDDRVALRIDGREILHLEYESGGQIPRNAAENTLLLLAGGGADCGVDSISVFRDVHYTDSGNLAVQGKEVALAAGGGQDQYFPCGDNSPSSYDGRYWGYVPERNMMGRALVVFWPLWPRNFQFKFIR